MGNKNPKRVLRTSEELASEEAGKAADAQKVDAALRATNRKAAETAPTETDTRLPMTPAPVDVPEMEATFEYEEIPDIKLDSDWEPREVYDRLRSVKRSVTLELPEGEIIRVKFAGFWVKSEMEAAQRALVRGFKKHQRFGRELLNLIAPVPAKTEGQ